MTLRWTPTALRDLVSLHKYIAADDPDAAARFVARIEEGVNLLPTQPDMGRRGRVARTREFVVPPYVVVYRVRGTEVAVIALIHTARRWPDSF
ncbi:MAG: type II toxin-antitoxin system RelE/ParE family toxin [Acidobacteriota bacterium]